MTRVRHLRKKVLVITNLCDGNEVLVAEKLGNSIKVVIPAVVRRFYEKESPKTVLTKIFEAGTTIENY